jgi:hypothetical protein
LISTERRSPPSEWRSVQRTAQRARPELLEERIAARLKAELGQPKRPDGRRGSRGLEALERPGASRLHGKLPKPPVKGEVEVLYAKLHDELRHLCDGEMVMTVINTDAWQSTVGARCRALDAIADPRRGYTHEGCERALLYQRLLGKRTHKAARKDMSSGDATAS